MKWQDYLTDEERASLAKAEEQRAIARERFNALHMRLKSAGERRMRKIKASEGADE